MSETTETETETATRPQPTLLEQMGGVSGLIYANVPAIAFVLGNGIGGLLAAIVAGMGAAAAIAVLRLVRREPVQPALAGLLGVAIAAFIAYQTGSAKGFFLPGIWLSLGAAVLFLATIVVRRPLVGVAWQLLTGGDRWWRIDRVARFAFDCATAAFVMVFAARFVVQQWLYDTDATGWLAFARIAMGYPLMAVALLVSAWAIRRARRRHQDLADRHAAAERLGSAGTPPSEIPSDGCSSLLR